MSSDARTARLEARLPASVYDLLKRAAELQGRSLSDFVVSSAREAAERAIAEHDVLRLSREDQIQFVESLLNPPPIADALKRAFESHRELIDPS